MKDIPVYDSVQDAVHGVFSEGTEITGKRAVPGGDANDTWMLSLSDGRRVFLKENTPGNARFFEAEAQGLSAIAETGAIRTPKLYARGADREAGRSFLLMEYQGGGEQIPEFWEVFGTELAAMHRSDAGRYVVGDQYGFLNDNYIGAGEQINSPRSSWIDFFTECRLEPQLKKASAYFGSDELRRFSRLLDRLPNYLVEPEHPSLLHGDLWSGNYIVGDDGKAWLIDPAAYVGHAEADMAMTELFGGFPREFYQTYRQEGLSGDGYEDRRDLYNLYHLLNHLNLFGMAYYPSVMRIVARYT